MSELKKDDKGFYYITGEVSAQTKRDLESLNDSVQVYSNMNKLFYKVQLWCIGLSAGCALFFFIKHFFW